MSSTTRSVGRYCEVARRRRLGILPGHDSSIQSDGQRRQGAEPILATALMSTKTAPPGKSGPSRERSLKGQSGGAGTTAAGDGDESSRLTLSSRTDLGQLVVAPYERMCAGALDDSVLSRVRSRQRARSRGRSIPMCAIPVRHDHLRNASALLRALRPAPAKRGGWPAGLPARRSVSRVLSRHC